MHSSTKRDDSDDSKNEDNTIMESKPQKFTKKQFNDLITQQDLVHLKEMLNCIKTIKKGFNFQYYSSWILLNNHNGMNPRSSFYSMCYSQLSELINSMSLRAKGTKISYPSFPWEDLSQLDDILSEDIFTSREGLLQLINQHVLLDIDELERRILFFINSIQLTTHTQEASLTKLFDGVEFKASGSIVPMGLPNIRKLSEFVLDVRRVEKIIALIQELALFNAKTQKGREAILSAIQIIGEIAKSISYQTRKECNNFPFVILKDLRDRIGDAWDNSILAENLLNLVEKDTKGIADIQRQLVSLNGDLVLTFNQLNTKMLESFNKPINEVWESLPPRSNSTPYCSVGSRSLSAIDSSIETIEQKLNAREVKSDKNHKIDPIEKYKNVLFVLKHALPKEHRESKDSQEKLELLMKLFKGELPAPLLDTSRAKLLGSNNKPIITGNVERLLGVVSVTNQCIENIKSENPARNNQFSKTIGTINKWSKFAGELLSYPELDKEVKINETEIKGLDQYIPPLENKKYTTEKSLLKTLLHSLARINSLSETMLQNNKNQLHAVRKECQIDKEYHHAVLYNLTVIGGCIRNLEKIPSFRATASPQLRKEFEALKWIRNSLMHEKHIDESGSIFQYFGNDLSHVSLRHDGGRAFDSNYYLQYIRSEIDKVIILMEQYHKEPSQFHIDNNESLHIQQLLYQQLESAVNKPFPSKEIINLLLQALNISCKKDESPIEKAEEILKRKNEVTLEVFLKNENEIEDLCQKYNIKVHGIFGTMAQYSYETHEGRSGFLISSGDSEHKGDFKAEAKLLTSFNDNDQNTERHIENISNFKKDLHALLGFRFLCITRNDLKEKISPRLKLTAIDIEKQVRHRPFKQVLRGYELYLAVKKRNISRIQALLRQEICLDLIVSGYTALHRSCMPSVEENTRGRDLRITELLLKAGANPNEFDKHGLSLLHYASKDDERDLLELMLKYGADPKLRSNNGDLPIELANEYDASLDLRDRLLRITKTSPQEEFIQAILMEDIPRLRKLLAKGIVDVNACNTNNLYPLQAACKRGNLKIVKILDQYGANFFQRCPNGETLLHVTCYVDNKLNLQLVEFLLNNKKLDPNIQDKCGDTALHQVIHCRRDVINLLIAYKANPNILNSEMFTPLIQLVNGNDLGNRKQFRNNVEALIKGGSSLTIESDIVGNALHHATEHNHMDIIPILLKYGADRNIKSKAEGYKGKTAYQIALDKMREELKRSLEALKPTPSLIFSSDEEKLNAEIASNFTWRMNEQKNNSNLSSVSSQRGGLVSTENKTFNPVALTKRQKEQRAIDLLEHEFKLLTSSSGSKQELKRKGDEKASVASSTAKALASLTGSVPAKSSYLASTSSTSFDPHTQYTPAHLLVGQMSKRQVTQIGAGIDNNSVPVTSMVRGVSGS